MAFQDFRSNASVNNIFKGRKVKLYRVPRRVALAYRAVKQGTKVALGDQLAGQFKPVPVYLTSGAGPIAAVKDIVVGAVPADGETVTIDGTALTFDGSTPTANQIDTTGGTTTAVAIQLAQEITQQIATVTAVVTVAGTVRVTHNTPNTALTIVDGTSGDLTINTITAQSAGTAAQTTYTITGTHITRTGISLILRGCIINGVPQHVYINCTIADGETATTLAAKLVACAIAAQAGSNPASGSRYWCTDQDATKTQIAAGIQLKYGTSGTNPTFIANTAGVITIKALASLGVAGNVYEVGAETLPGGVADITNDTAGVPQLPGIEQWGYTIKFNYDGSVSKTGIPSDQQLNDVARSTSGATSKISFELLCDEDFELLAEANGLSAIAKGDTREQLLVNFADDSDTFGFIFVTSDPNFDGEWINGVALECESSGLKFGRELRAHTNVPVELALNAVEGGDETFYVSRYRPAVVAA